ncbi:MAG: alpha-glucan family phosphorylase [Bradymonadales bacterium]|nr:alpha-glucan family phosphorylase [Bradymonadales bacterium]
MSALWNGLDKLAHNFWWSWDAQATHLFRQLDPEVWEASGHSAIAILDTLGEEATLQRLRDSDMVGQAEEVLARLQSYLECKEPWKASEIQVPPESGPVAYFCAEYGIQESLRIYAGGLGILAGDHCKSASDLGIPLVAVGLAYREGYFTQLIDPDGRQQAYYGRSDFERMALEPVCDGSGRFETLSVPMDGGEVIFCMWRTQIGRVEMILLDTLLFQNSSSDRALTLRLYGGMGDTRIRQEMLLGIGGMKALRFLGYQPSVFHMNEGHTAFLTLERLREKVTEGKSIETAMEEVRQSCLFTTHTPVPAGHDRFAPDLVERHLGWLRQELGMDRQTFEGLGRVNPQDPGETFCMTVLALKLSRGANGVSALHGDVSRRMWHSLWPNQEVDQVPIGHITNGVHIETWIASEMRELLDSHLGVEWRQKPWDPKVWERVESIPDSLLWAVHCLLKTRLVKYARESELNEYLRHHKRGALVVEHLLDPDALTIGFARRFATYKRGDLIFRDLDRARRLFTNPDRPVQILFSGKAHPQDFGGGEIIRRVVAAANDPMLGDHVTFIPNYGIEVARLLVQGVDVWLNTPRRPREASGTSGQKVPLNGGINISTVDGWWCEGFNGKNGWNIGDPHRSYSSEWDHDQQDHESLMRILEHEIIPLYYDRDADGLPKKWIAMMKESLRSVGQAFSSHRMVRDYATRYYWPT